MAGVLVGRQDQRLKDFDVITGGSVRTLPDGMCICGMCRSCRASDRAAGMPVIDPARPIATNDVRVRGERTEGRTASTRSERRRQLMEERKAERIDVGGRMYAPNCPQHGTSHGYKHWHCRCIPCSNARAQEGKVGHVTV